ncbi:hypothetical protein Tco_1333146, partial [Tanacetum coccineum]
TFLWHTRKNVFRDPTPKPTEFNANHHALFIAHPAPFRMFLEPFLCMVGMSRYYTLNEDTYPSFRHNDDEEMDLAAFIHVLDPTKVKVMEREHGEEEPKLLETIVGRVVQPYRLLLLVKKVLLMLVLRSCLMKVAARNVAAETTIAKKPTRHRKKRPAVTDTGGSSHPLKRLRDDNGTASGAATGGKSPSAIKELLARSILNVEVGVAAVETLPLVTSSVSATLERESGDPTDSIIGPNLCERFVISLDTSHHSSNSATDAKVDFVITSVAPLVMAEAVVTASIVGAFSIPPSGAIEEPQARPSIFHYSSSAGTIRPDVAGPSYLPGKELSMGSREVNSESLHEIFVPRWNVPNDTLLDDHDISHEFIDHLAPPVLFSQIHAMDYHHLFTEYNVGTARQACLNAEVRMRTKYCLSEMRRLETECEKQKNVALEDEKDYLNGKVTDLQSLVSAKDLELKDFNATVTSLKSQNDNLVDQVHAPETTCSGLHDQVSGYEHLKEQIEEF